MRPASYLFAGAVAGAVLTAAIKSPFVLAGASAAGTDAKAELVRFNTVFQAVVDNYVTAPGEAALMEAAVSNMLSSLDPHSSYMNAKAYKAMEIDNRGEFGGLGFEVTMVDGLVKIVTPLDDTPASRGGLLSNDLIVGIDGQPVQGLTLTQAVDKMRGEVNTPVTLTIQRSGVERPFDIRFVRAIITIQPVKVRTDAGDVGIIKINQFTEKTFDGLRKAIDKIKSEVPDSKLRGYVLDLRNNPGGLLDQSISVSDAFLESGEVVSLRGRRTGDTRSFKARAGDLTGGKPVIVLINGGSASASEIVAGALQDHRRATVVGTTSFGKGSVQTIFPLSAGNGALRLTTARYYTPVGRSIQALGIVPDIDVKEELPPELANVGLRATGGEAALKGHLANETANREEKGSSAYVSPDPAKDTQLVYALTMLRSGRPAPASR